MTQFAPNEKPKTSHLRPAAVTALLVLFLVSAGLMIGAMRQESATVDETVMLGAGYSYWLGYRYQLNCEHPPLAQLLATVPLRMFDPKLPDYGIPMLDGHVLAETSERWDWREGGEPLLTRVLFPRGPDFYYYSFSEQTVFGGGLIYGGQNDAEKLLFWGRIPEVALTLLTGLLVFLWARRAQGDAAGLLAASMFLLNPVVLSYGHIIQTDIAMALTFSFAVWMFVRLLEAPSTCRSVLAGVALGLALATKYSAIVLGPTFVVLWLLHCWRHRAAPTMTWKHALAVGAVAYGVILVTYIPHWAPAPSIDPARAAKLGIPSWFLTLRPILIPSEYFKGLAIQLQRVATGNDAYLNGNWSYSGWWYYFPLAFAFKTPIPFLLFAAVRLVLVVRWHRQATFDGLAAWAATAVYLLFAMHSKVDIGVRHILPVYPLVSVAAACAVGRWMTRSMTTKVQKFATWCIAALPAAALVSTLLAYPFFISYMNPLAGGVQRGYEHLLDSNFDWGQDVKRLKQFLEERGIRRIYLQYFGTQAAIEYYQIPNDFVGSEQARQIQRGWLVISINALMRPEWQWLREAHQPVDRIGSTLFVFKFGDPPRT